MGTVGSEVGLWEEPHPEKIDEGIGQPYTGFPKSPILTCWGKNVSKPCFSAASSLFVGHLKRDSESREINNSFILGHPFNGVLGSPAPEQGGTDQVVLGDQASAYVTQQSGT